MAVLPFFHIYGMNTIMNLTLYRRGTLVTMPKMELPTFLDLVQSRRVTYLYIAPPIAVALAKHPIVDDYDLSSIRRDPVRGPWTIYLNATQPESAATDGA